MFVQGKSGVCKTGLAAGVATLALFWATPGIAQQAAANAPSDSAMVNLVRLLVEQKILTREKGEALLAQAQAEAAQARAAQAQAAQPAAPVQQAATELPPPPAGTVRVPYVPESVRAKIREELRTEVLAQAKAERWAAPEQAAPEWVRDFQIHGDFRFRSASALFGKDNAEAFFDVPQFNAGGPYDPVHDLLPSLNTTRNKINNMQIRARINMTAMVANRFELGFQLASGDNAGPVSTNATLTGEFQKRNLWIQNAYLKGDLVPGITAMLGRFDNPFRTTDMLFDPDLALDGVYGQLDLGRVIADPGFSVQVRGGAFPITYEDINYPSTSVAKRNFRDRYLFSGQLELAKEFAGGVKVDLSAGYHNFTFMRGHLSEPCDVYSANGVECSTDALRPLWATKGNTIMFLRRFNTERPDDPANPSQPQFVGLKFAYRVLDLNAAVSVPVSGRNIARLTGTYLHNFGFDPQNLCRDGRDGQPLNNVVITNPSDTLQGACDANPARFVGGNEGFGAYFSIGDPALFSVNPRRAQKGAWAINLAYKYLQSDVTLDSFTDSDFHLGGTNAKGYIIGGAWAPFEHITLGGRWLSSNQVSGPPLAIDVLHLDLGVAF